VWLEPHRHPLQLHRLVRRHRPLRPLRPPARPHQRRSQRQRPLHQSLSPSNKSGRRSWRNTRRRCRGRSELRTSACGSVRSVPLPRALRRSETLVTATHVSTLVQRLVSAFLHSVHVNQGRASIPQSTSRTTVVCGQMACSRCTLTSRKCFSVCKVCSTPDMLVCNDATVPAIAATSIQATMPRSGFATAGC
jgi:hypothetical protein